MNRYGLFLIGSLCVLAGCHGKDQTPRGQADDDADKFRVQTIGDISEFQTAGTVPISGVGLVVGLEGTGGSPPPGEFRTILEQYLKKCRIENPKEWIDSPNNAMVLVNAEVPVGSRRGERIHVEITLPPGSKARSLRGGYLLETQLMTYSSLSQVRAIVEQATDTKPVSTGDGLLKGHVIASAEGPLQVVLNDKENARSIKQAEGNEGGVKRAWVWKGARTKSDQPFFIVMNPEHKQHRKAIGMADRINETFHGPGSPDKIAAARNSDTVLITIPAQYRTNLPHFLRVVRMIPLQRTDENGDYFRKLAEQLKQPETTLSAGLRLEALGRGSIPTMRQTMQNSPYPLVRFACAEALAYLGEPISASELGRLAGAHPSMRAFCLTALASLDEAASTYALQDLMLSENPEIRYGAFRALRELDPRNEAVRGRLLQKSFWLHDVGGDSTPLVHVLTNQRAEVVTFGKQPQFTAPFSLRAGPEIILTAKRGDQRCTITRFSARKSERQEQASFAVADIVKTLADMGALYEDVATLLMEARDTKCLNCDLAVDAMPKEVPIQKLAENAHVDKKMENEKELLKTVAPDQDQENVFDRSAYRR